MLSRRKLIGKMGKAAATSAIAGPFLRTAILSGSEAPNSVAGVDRVVVLTGKTYLHGWAGYGNPPRPHRRGPDAAPADPPARTLPATAVTTWTRESGPDSVTFADPKALITTASFNAPGKYVLKLTADDGKTKSVSTLNVKVEAAPPAKQLDAVYTKRFKVNNPLWSARTKALMVSWIPHCIDQINRTDLDIGEGGIDNFVEAGKKLRGEPHGRHKGYVFSNAWVHQTVEAMSIALMIDPQGDGEIVRAQAKMRVTLDDWIPKILAAQEADGYLQTAFTLSRDDRKLGVIDTSDFKHWDPKHRSDHEGYTAGYFLESAINHYLMTDKKDARMYNAAKKLADCWYNNIGPAPKKAWYDGHQEMEQALVRFGRFVDDMERDGSGQKYIQ